MPHEHTFRPRHPRARRVEIMEANMPALQRDAQEQARSMLERDFGTGCHFEGIDTGGGFSFSLPQLRMGGDRR